MLFYILKSSACLLILLGFYKLFLEREHMHGFKRFYLLGALVVSFCIPLITFTSYVFIAPMEEFALLDQNLAIQNVEEASLPINYLPIILWTIYGFGVLLFTLKFIYNLWRIVIKIRRNPRLKTKNFINVLLEDLAIPHTFFNFIFLDKYKFEAQKIPKEVLVHEQTHATQKHSLDILFIELLQIVFWFNPLIYFAKHSIKLNHEFLADQAVLNQGTTTSNYQNILLSFSSTNYHPQFTNAINYSFIKKRFTIMKTRTSKRTSWLKSLVLLPLLAGLIYGFSEKVTIEKLTPQTEELQINKAKQDNINRVKEYIDKERAIEKSNQDTATYASIKTTLEDINKLKLNYTTQGTPNQLAEYNRLAKYYKSIPKGKLMIKVVDIERLKYLYNIISPAQKQQAESFPNFPILLAPPPKMDTIYTYNRMANHVKYVAKNRKANLIYLTNIYHEMTAGQKQQVISPSQLTKIFYFQDKATPEQLAEYNRLATYYNAMSKENMIVKLKDVKRLEYLYSIMSTSQKKSAQKFPNFPPPPPPPPTMDIGNIKKGSKELQAASKQFSEITENYVDAIRKYYKTKTNYSDLKPLYKRVMDVHKVYAALAKKENVAVPPPPPPVPEPKIIEEQEIIEEREVVEEREVIEEREIEEEREIIEVAEEIPPPPPPISPLDHIISLAKKGATFYYEGQKVSSDKAIALVKNKTNMHIQVRKHDSDNPIVYLSKKPIHVETKKQSSQKKSGAGYANFMHEMKNKGGLFYFEGQRISYNQTVELKKKYGKLNMLTQKGNSYEPLIFLSRKEITKKDIDKI